MAEERLAEGLGDDVLVKDALVRRGKRKCSAMMDDEHECLESEP